jgi:hypothetical protein
MYGTVIFCSDGVLRLRSPNGDARLVPLVLLQRSQKISDERFILKMLRNHCEIEQGTTMGAFLLSIEHWQDVLKDLLDIDVAAYIEEVRMPALPNNQFDYLEIRHCSRIKRDYKVIEPDDSADIVSSNPFHGLKYEALDSFSIESKLDICGRSNDEALNYSLSYVPMSSLRAVPIVLNRKPAVLETKKNREGRPNLFNDIPGVGQTEQYLFPICTNTLTFTLLDILETVCCEGLFDYSPTLRDEGAEILKSSLAEIKDLAKLEVPDNVTPIFQSSTLRAVEPVDPQNKITESPTSEVNGEDFISDEDDEGWNEMLNNLPKDLRYRVVEKEVVEAPADMSRIGGEFITSDSQPD